MTRTANYIIALSLFATLVLGVLWYNLHQAETTLLEQWSETYVFQPSSFNH